jgi:NAD(P)H-flavin reductase
MCFRRRAAESERPSADFPAMHRIVSKTRLSPNVTRLDVEARRIAEIRQPGQFVIVRRAPRAERIPLTIADADPAAGTIALVIQAVGQSTRALTSLEVGGAIADVSGPLGLPTELIAQGRALCVGGGVGTAVVHPIAQGLQRRGVYVTTIIGGRSKEWVIFEDELRRLGQVVVCTDDGSYGRKGFVTDAAKELLADDARCGQLDAAARRADYRVPQSRHDRRHRHVRRLSRGGRRPDEIRLRRRSGVRRPPGQFRPAGRTAEHLPPPRTTGARP